MSLVCLLLSTPSEKKKKLLVVNLDIKENGGGRDCTKSKSKRANCLFVLFSPCHQHLAKPNQHNERVTGIKRETFTLVRSKHMR